MQHTCREECVNYMRNKNTIYTSYEVVWGKANEKGWYIYTKSIMYGDFSKLSSWLIIFTKIMYSFKPYEYGLCQNNKNKLLCSKLEIKPIDHSGLVDYVLKDVEVLLIHLIKIVQL